MIPLRRYTAAVVLMCMAASVHADVDASTPKAAFRAYTVALAAGDKSVREMVIAGPDQLQLLDGQLAYGQVEKRFRDALIKRFPEVAKELPSPVEQTLASIDTADAKITGDTATLQTRDSIEVVRLKRDGARWKIDLATMYGGDQLNDVILFRRALSEVIETLTDEVSAGKFTSYADVRDALEVRVKMRLAMPPAEEPATQPEVMQPEVMQP